MRATALLLTASSTVMAFSQLSGITTRAKSQLAASDKDSGEMSKALPFVPRPKLLDGSLPGDVGFE